MKIEIIDRCVVTENFVIRLEHSQIDLDEIERIISSDFSNDVKIEKLKKFGKVFEAIN